MSIGSPYDEPPKAKPILQRLQRLYGLGLAVLIFQFYAGSATCIFFVWSAMSQYLNDRKIYGDPSGPLPGWVPEAQSFIHWLALVMAAGLPTFWLAWRARPQEERWKLPLSLVASAPFAGMLLFIAGMASAVRVMEDIIGV